MSDSLLQASDWYIRLNADDVTAADKRAFQQWLDASIQNLKAWERVESVNSPFLGIDPLLSKTVLLKRDALSLSRRQMLKKMGIVVVAGTTGLIAYRQQPWETMLADYSTPKGKIQTVSLSDNTVLVLNTDSAIDVKFTETGRIIQLIKGEVLIETGHGPGSNRPFSVHTSAGIVKALGTRFSVRQHDDYVSVNVFEDSVLINLAELPSHEQKLHSGLSITFTTQALSDVQPLTPGANLWSRGILSVVDMPLIEFLKELNRYHRGFLRCAPDIENTLISGSFPLNDLNAILVSIQETHHLRVNTVTRYWITISKAS